MPASSSSATNDNRRARVVVRNKCYCGEECGMWTSWPRKNPGRRFVGCPNYWDKQRYCRYIVWLDPALPSKWYKELMFDLKSPYADKVREEEATIAGGFVNNQVRGLLENRIGGGLFESQFVGGGVSESQDVGGGGVLLENDDGGDGLDNPADVGNGLGSWKIAFYVLLVVVLVVVVIVRN